jgi:transposase
MDMPVIVPRACGLDVHKKTVQACVHILDKRGQGSEALQTFGTTTRQLLALRDWLMSLQVTHVAMESTGVYWKPLWHLLAGDLQCLLVNAQHIKHVPGRKTDVTDSQWIAQLLQHGLLRSSFVPDPPPQQWRDLTRLRTPLVAKASQAANRIQKVLEDANIKLASVASDPLGVSGRAMLHAMIDGQQDPVVLASYAKGRLRSKNEELKEALLGRVTEHHRFLLQVLLDDLAATEQLIERVEQRIEEAMAPFAPQIQLLDQIPGVDLHVAHVILAEVGPDMSRFPSAAHLCSWAAMSPGNHESAGKRQSGKTRKANRWLRAALVQAGWAASHTKNTYLASLYARLVGRRGKKRALIACGHSILNSVYYMLRDNVPYADLGSDHYERTHGQRLARMLVARLEAQGYTVTLERHAA